MTFISEHSISLGKYVVSPTIHPTESGEFLASVAIKSGQGSGTHHKVFRFDSIFPTREAAHLFAMAQGRLRTGVGLAC